MTQALGSADGVTITGPPEDRYGEVLTDRALALIAELHRSFDGRRRELLAARQERYAQLAAGGHARLPGRDQGRPRGPELAGGRAGAGPGRPAGGDHRTDRPQDDDQRAQLRAPRCGWPTRRTPTRRTGRTWSAARSTSRDALDRHDRLHLARGQGLRARPTTGRPRSSSGRAAGTCRRSTSSSTASRPPAAWSTSPCTWCTTRRRCSTPARGPTSTCRRWRATSRRGCGTTCSSPRRSSSACPAARSGRRC